MSGIGRFANAQGALPASGAVAPWLGEVSLIRPEPPGPTLRFTSAANTLGFCGAPYRYGPSRVPTLGPPGSGASFSLEAVPEAPLPDGLSVVATTGELLWRPRPSQSGLQAFTLVAERNGERAEQRIEITVECDQPTAATVSCACSEASGLPSWAALTACWWWARRRRAR